MSPVWAEELQYFYVERGGIEVARNVGKRAFREILIEPKDGRRTRAGGSTPHRVALSLGGIKQIPLDSPDRIRV